MENEDDIVAGRVTFTSYDGKRKIYLKREFLQEFWDVANMAGIDKITAVDKLLDNVDTIDEYGKENEVL